MDTPSTVVTLLRDGRFSDLETIFAPRLRAVASADTVRMAWSAEVARVGPVVSVGEPVLEAGEAGLVRASVGVACRDGRLTVVMSLDDVGKLHGLRLAPHTSAYWTPPPYADVRRFREEDLTVGGQGATLTLPHSGDTGVVLLAGGGPFDRDATHGPNKPLKDLAWGLASRGVAVLRFDKVTFGRPGLASTPGFTMTDEYVPHAVAAVRLLRERVDRVFLVGHSMGGKVAPRVAAAEQSVAGLVLLAADAEPMHHAAVRIARHPALNNDAAATDAITRQAALVDGPDLTPATPARDLPFGLAASYWLDLRDYDPVTATAELGLPTLILQGGRDYQVTVDDDLARWRAGLGDADIRVYGRDNHLFFPGAGPSTPAEYEVPGHVDKVVVKDIAGWLRPGRRWWR